MSPTNTSPRPQGRVLHGRDDGLIDTDALNDRQPAHDRSGSDLRISQGTRAHGPLGRKLRIVARTSMRPEDDAFKGGLDDTLFGGSPARKHEGCLRSGDTPLPGDRLALRDQRGLGVQR